jgi:hypothetical protein
MGWLGGILGDIGGGIGDIGSTVGGALGTAGSDIWNEASNIGLPSTTGQGLGWNWGTLIPGALGISGFINNFLLQQRMNQLRRQAQDPNYYQRFIQPLDAGAVAEAKNMAQAALGKSGLTLSGPIAAATYAQALAPLVAEQQRLGVQEAESSLGTASGLLGQPSNVWGPLAALMQRANNPAATAQAAARAATDVGSTASTTPDVGIGSTGTIPDYYQLPTAPDWASLPSGSFQAPDWSAILGVPPVVPTFDTGSSFGGGLGI